MRDEIAKLEAELKALTAALHARARMVDLIRADMFDRQLALYDDPHIRRAAHPGRRSGKSEFIPRAALLDVLRAGFEETIIIGAETKHKAKSLHWFKVLKVAKKAGLVLELNKSDGTMRTVWGAQIVFWGLKDESSAELLRGFKVRSAYFDEVATYAPLLKRICDDVVGPALEDTGGPLTLCGTPSYTRSGHWFEICCNEEGEKRNWSVHHWTILENPRFPRDARAVLEAAAKRYGGWDNPTFLREYLGQFVNDDGMQVYRYVETRDDAKELPAPWERMLLDWQFVLGVDFGFNDDCAWTVLGWHPRDPDRRVWVLESFKHAELDVDQAAKVTAELCAKYGIWHVVGDTGGLGKPYAVQWNRRYAGREYEVNGRTVTLPPMEPADKREKLAHIRLLNTEMQAGRVRVYRPRCEDLATEILVLPWKDPKREKEHPSFSNHCADSFLYAFTKVTAFLSRAPDSRPDAAKDPVGHERWQEQREIQELMGSRDPDGLESYRSAARASAWTSFARFVRWAHRACASATWSLRSALLTSARTTPLPAPS